MWFLLWLALVMLLAGFWVAPDYWQRRVYPRVRLEAGPVKETADPGEAVELRIRLTNPTALPCPRVRLDFQLPDELAIREEGGGDGRVRLTTYLLPRQTAELALTVYAARRGVARWNQAELHFTDMFGLRHDDRTVYPQALVVVRPRRLAAEPVGRLMNGLVGDIRVRRYDQEDPSLFTGVRAYRSGDPLRSVSWYATARTGGLMVKQFGHTTESRVLLLLNGQMNGDFWMVASRERLDRLCERVLQVADALLAERAEAGFLTNLTDSLGGGLYLPPAPGLVQRERIANRLGSISRHPAHSLAELVRSAQRLIRPGDTLVLVTDFRTPEADAALTELRRHGCSVHIAEAVPARKAAGSTEGTGESGKAETLNEREAANA
ncbi:DUF58 domain-containing protein [Gorillibacterium sp. sgz500922]|uniref:DUF58 domain-containing protein n=1 Tax=Gorillibacterium sp. sgz500922 TaxID=3446694 RepID=UPI003F676F88